MENITRLVVLLCLACALPAQAQRGLKPHAKTSRAFSKAHLSAYRPMYGAVYQSIALNPALPFPAYVGVDRSRIYETVTVTQKRSWLEQQRRDFKAWQLKRQHAKTVALYQQIAALPKLQEAQRFQAENLTDFRVQEGTSQQLPALPALERPGYLYRGLGLSAMGQDMHNIFQNGLRVQDAGQNSNYLLMALASNPHSAAAVSSAKYTNLTQQPKLAVDYALRNSRFVQDGVAVVVVVTGEEEHGKVIQVSHDIPAEHIQGMFVLLNIKGTPTWCLVERQEGQFVITPYENK